MARIFCYTVIWIGDQWVNGRQSPIQTLTQPPQQVVRLA
jgi:hypothetical protein